MKEYKVTFDFTTIHTKSRFVGRSGECFITSVKDLSEDDFKDDELLYICAKAVHNIKPSYKIFSLTIKSITQPPTQPAGAKPIIE